ncbi:hypothetical protein EV426DRAFT_683350 [Tirmania nivea]|nr:hypothetical protein EV426DRAFT_683350 [Tirmania nivea]
MSGPGQLNAEVARLLQILASTAQAPPPPVAPPTADPRRRPPPPPHAGPPAPPAAAHLDPSSITTWPTALRYITATIAPNAPAMARLSRMKQNQRDNELAWHLSREELVRKQHARAEGSRRVDEILRQFPPAGGSAPQLPDPEQDAHELRAFDLKVHRAASAMVAAMAAELAQLGMPFFCGGRGGTPRQLDDADGLEEEELRELRRRVMELVGDLVGE